MSDIVSYLRTSKPISSICYQSPDHLRRFLNSYVNDDIISYYAFISHKGEHNEKDHIHLYIEPTGNIDTGKLRVQLDEYVIGHDKPLRCMPFRKSNLDEWFLYSIHDKEFLDKKHEIKEFYNYPISDIITSDTNLLTEDYLIKVKCNIVESIYTKIKFCIAEGYDKLQTAEYCQIPLSVFRNFDYLYDLIYSIINRG